MGAGRVGGVAGKPKEWEWALSNGHKWTLNRTTLARGRQNIVGTASETTERTSCPAMKILVLGAEINLLLL